MRRLVVGLVALIAFGALGGYVAGAVTRSGTDAAGAGSRADLVVVRSGPQSALDVSAPLQVPSATVTVTVPSNHEDVFDIRFSGVVAYPGGPSFPVAVDVTVDGFAIQPSGLPAWPSASVSPLPFQLERAVGPLPSGTYQIGIQLTGANANDRRPLQLLGWTLVAERTGQHASNSSDAGTSADGTPGTTAPRGTVPPVTTPGGNLSA